MGVLTELASCTLPRCSGARYKATALRARRISIDDGDFKFSNCGGLNIGAEVLATLRTIEVILFYMKAKLVS
jgi:hypothetical protein